MFRQRSLHAVTFLARGLITPRDVAVPIVVFTRGVRVVPVTLQVTAEHNAVGAGESTEVSARRPSDA